jgi:hypothetical protein
MEPRTYIFDRLVDARQSLVGKSDQITVEGPQAFAASNASGDLRPFSDHDEIQAVAEASAKRLKRP